jgi:uncharacterized repeat protein (TIGR01451 family)
MKKLLITLILVALMLISPAMAWGASVNVAAVDDNSGTYSTYVQSSTMGRVYYSDYSQTFTTVQPANVNAATLANYDTLFLFACNPSVFTAQQKADIVAFVTSGGKLIIWDSEEPGYLNQWDYSWLPSPFLTAVPGAQGARGILTIVEENVLSSNDPTSPYFISEAILGSNTDAVGDANVFTSYVPADWCVDMLAKNVLNIEGPTHVYTKSVGTGIIIYCGLDWDYAGTSTGWGSDTSGAYHLKKILQQEFNADSLPCNVQPSGNLDVTKTADKACYTVGETITFTVTVTNPANNPYTASNVGLVDYPPAEVTLIDPASYALGDLAPGQSVVTFITGTAAANGNGLENSAVATGYYMGAPVFTGGDTVTFNIGCNNVPEFPTLALPIGLIIGMMGAVAMIRRRKE